MIGSVMSKTYKVTSAINEILVSGNSTSAGILLDEQNSMVCLSI